MVDKIDVQDRMEDENTEKSNPVGGGTGDIAKNLQDIIPDDVYLKHAPEAVETFYMGLSFEDKKKVQEVISYHLDRIYISDENGKVLFKIDKQNLKIAGLPLSKKTGEDGNWYEEYDTSKLRETSEKRPIIRNDVHDTYMNLDGLMSYVKYGGMSFPENPQLLYESAIKRMPAGDYDPSKFNTACMQFFSMLGGSFSGSYSGNKGSNNNKFDTGEVGFLLVGPLDDKKIYGLEVDNEKGRLYTLSRDVIIPYRHIKV